MNTPFFHSKRVPRSMVTFSNVRDCKGRKTHVNQTNQEKWDFLRFVDQKYLWFLSDILSSVQIGQVHSSLFTLACSPFAAMHSRWNVRIHFAQSLSVFFLWQYQQNSSCFSCGIKIKLQMTCFGSNSKRSIAVIVWCWNFAHGIFREFLIIWACGYSHEHDFILLCKFPWKR